MNISIFAAFIIVMALPYSAFAQGHSAYCQKVDSTAASQECLKQHLKIAQSNLNEIYKKLANTLEEERKVELKNLQKTWLTYRDAECMWEADRPDEEVLKHVSELSCMARVTEDRADLLTVAYGDVSHPDVQREFGDFPRWMNSLANEYPDIYWNYGASIKADVNCDGQEEHIMTGIQIGKKYNDIHFAVIENPPVGKPKPSLFSFTVVGEEENEQEGAPENSICSNDIRVEIQDIEPVEEVDVDGADNIAVCTKSLLLTPKGCAPKVINWTGKQFDIAVEKEPIDEKAKEKN